ncbi:sulfatase family protein [Novipirellula artificiosorum]|uniref:Arylsulfatase n=1 Tax=Novipirellula artificiosorum TaxID=2528016 RepID=A0A5C6DUC5_9BACT|nr:sulfatase-like hydrolase/transferase [Novipirellula artificiosorum]TWU38369.1 Arylsulfatase [Novipirellula artificiosorum]
MTRKYSSRLTAAWILVLAAAFTHAADDPIGKPNVIFLMDDQHRWDTLGRVNSIVKTPNLDALAQSGVFYDQAVCQAPMCIPSRNSMMLGLYPNQTGVLRNGRGIPDGQLPSQPLPELFRDAGYQTAGFGKTHWGVTCSTRGFETRYIGECLEKDAVMMIDDAPDAKKRYDSESHTMGAGEENNLGYLGFTSQLPELEHRDGWVTGKCLDFIDSKLDPERPLFLYLSFLKPHAGHNVPAGYEKQYRLDQVEYAKQPPWTEDRSPHAAGVNRRDLYVDYWGKATDEQWRLMTMRYRANCTWIDDMFGRVLRELERKGVLDNALIVYCSDHGEMLGERFYRFNKYCLYESSVRVPLILSGSAIPEELQGKTDHRPAELVDLYPTVLGAAGITIPQQAVGMNLLGKERRPASFSSLHERGNEAAFMWRTADYKLILRMKRRADDNACMYTAADIIGGEFYNLAEDPQEWYDLYPDLAASRNPRETMTRELLKFLKSQRTITRP